MSGEVFYKKRSGVGYTNIISSLVFEDGGKKRERYMAQYKDVDHTTPVVVPHINLPMGGKQGYGVGQILPHSIIKHRIKDEDSGVELEFAPSYDFHGNHWLATLCNERVPYYQDLTLNRQEKITEAGRKDYKKNYENQMNKVKKRESIYKERLSASIDFNKVTVMECSHDSNLIVTSANGIPYFYYPKLFPGTEFLYLVFPKNTRDLIPFLKFELSIWTTGVLNKFMEKQKKERCCGEMRFHTSFNDIFNSANGCITSDNDYKITEGVEY